MNPSQHFRQLRAIGKVHRLETEALPESQGLGSSLALAARQGLGKQLKHLFQATSGITGLRPTLIHLLHHRQQPLGTQGQVPPAAAKLPPPPAGAPAQNPSRRSGPCLRAPALGVDRCSENSRPATVRRQWSICPPVGVCIKRLGAIQQHVANGAQPLLQRLNQLAVELT